MAISDNKNLKSSYKLFILGVIMAIFIAFLDIFTKRLVFMIIDQNVSISNNYNIEYIMITDYFNLVKVWNKGVSFGLFDNYEYSKIIFSIIVSFIALIILIWMFFSDRLYLTIALAFIIGGALGNLCDRITHGAVADFLDFHLKSYHWPAFNLADSFVFIGVAMLIIDDLFINRRK